MRHPDEHTIDLYILAALSLGEPMRRDVEAHLKECPDCQEMAAFLRSFYEELRQSQEIPFRLTPHQEAFISKLTPNTQVIRLHPYKPHPASFATRRQDFVVLAAKPGGKNHTSRFETVATLASEAEKMLLRIVYDNSADLFRAYLHAEDPSMIDRALVSFRTLSTSLVLDEHGKAEFRLPGSERPKDWSLVDTAVRPSVGSIRFATAKLIENGTAALSVEGRGRVFKVVLSYESDKLTINVSGHLKESQCSIAVIDPAPHPSVMVEFHGSKQQVLLPNLPDEMTLRLYG